MTDDRYSNQRLADRARITDALLHYCRAIDRQQLGDLLTHVFHEDATTDNGHYKGDIPGFIAMVQARHSQIPQAFHMVGNVLIDFLGDDRAFVETYCLAMEHHPNDPLGPIERVVRVRYADVFERRGGLWKIASRAVILDHEMGIPTALCAPPFLTGERFRGVRNASDPAVLQRRALGLLT
ncbi:MAG: nuclear transport factor 2 family protein [Rhodocyclaceae bacterium]|jgi:hypothetical protein|nr:nuclear transport factor 2 family protein [Rhodocyclaceae bacterium]